jgi:hypothetical protein
MKITKSKLKDILKEELALEAEEEAAAEPEEKLKSDVEVIKKKLEGYLKRINTAEEYAQLLQMILAHPVDRKQVVLKKLYKAYQKMMQES